MIVKEYSYYDNSTAIANTLGMKSELNLLKKLDLPAASNPQENGINPVQSAVSGNRVDQVMPQSQGSTNIVTPLNYRCLTLNLHRGGYNTVRAGTCIENFDLILEPSLLVEASECIT